jgi:hypothetical protein
LLAMRKNYRHRTISAQGYLRSDFLNCWKAIVKSIAANNATEIRSGKF